MHKNTKINHLFFMNIEKGTSFYRIVFSVEISRSANSRIIFLPTHIFSFGWLQKHFIRRIKAENNLVIFKWHASHFSDSEILNLAAENDTILLYLPNHLKQRLHNMYIHQFSNHLKHFCKMCVTQQDAL